MEATGYEHPGYARSLSEFGEPLALARSGACLLERRIPEDASLRDAMGCYPYLTCENWPALAGDLASLDSALVSIAAAPDPFGAFTLDDLERAFPHRVVHFKDHYVAELSRPRREIASPRHRAAAKKALRHVEVECTDAPSAHLEEFAALFVQTVERFQVTGIRAFSRASLAAQLALPGCFMSIARTDGRAIAAHVQMRHRGTIYAHVSGAAPEANALGASYALYYEELAYFSDKAARIDWGGDAGSGQRDTGLSAFKRGWSTTTRPVYFCGRVCNPERYDALAATRKRSPGYFPAYRDGELAATPESSA